MKKNRIILVVVIGLAIIALVLVLTRSDKTFKRALSDFAVGDTATITKIFMSDKNNHTVTLSRELDGPWMVNNRYRASRFNMDMLLQTMHNLEVREPVPQAAHNTIIRELAVNAVKVEIYQQVYRIDLFHRIRWFPHEKLTKVYYVGGATQSNRGSYMLMEHSSTPFVTYLPGFRGFVSPRYKPMENAWRDHTVFHKDLTEIASVEVLFPGKGQESYRITNQENQSVLLVALPEERMITDFDTLAVLNFLTGFRALNFEAILNDMEPRRKDSILSSTPLAIITLTGTDGINHTTKAYFKEGRGEMDIHGKPIPYDLDRLYALVNDGQDFVLIQYFAFDRVLRPRSFFHKVQPAANQNSGR